MSITIKNPEAPATSRQISFIHSLQEESAYKLDIEPMTADALAELGRFSPWKSMDEYLACRAALTASTDNLTMGQASELIALLKKA